VKGKFILALFIPALATLVGCGGGSTASSGGNGGGGSITVATPTISMTAQLNGAQLISMADGTPGTAIYFTVDGSTPNTSSALYISPLLLTANATVKAVAYSGSTASQVASQSISPNIASGTLVWSDEFTNTTAGNIAPNSTFWTYDTGAGGWGNQELETYCAWGSSAAPCDANNPNAYIGTDGYLHIVARQPSSGVYTSARLKTQGLFSLAYGRVEARMLLPQGQGLWPAFWMLGNNITKVSWPACGEQDIMEHINAPTPDWIAGSIHGTNLSLSQQFFGTGGQTFSAAEWHTYGMIWSPGHVEYYVDSPDNVYATYTTTTGQSGAVWPFDSGSGAFLILNLAVGGNWPGSPNQSTGFPSEVLVDYVRIYSN
jgi:beta-glucanase (GH16 family)